MLLSLLSFPKRIKRLRKRKTDGPCFPSPLCTSTRSAKSRLFVSDPGTQGSCPFSVRLLKRILHFYPRQIRRCCWDIPGGIQRALTVDWRTPGNNLDAGTDNCRGNISFPSNIFDINASTWTGTMPRTTSTSGAKDLGRHSKGWKRIFSLPFMAGSRVVETQSMWKWPVAVRNPIRFFDDLTRSGLLSLTHALPLVSRNERNVRKPANDIGLAREYLSTTNSISESISHFGCESRWGTTNRVRGSVFYTIEHPRNLNRSESPATDAS